MPCLMSTRQWKLARRSLPYGERTLVMGVLNVTPDSFSDGGEFFSLERAVAHAEQMIAEAADIIDIGGESTRPGSAFVSEGEELQRVIPVIERLATKSPVPISIDTTKSSVARAAIAAGAEIVNDISGLRFDPLIADEAARAKAGLVLMHSRGTPKDMQQLPPVEDIMREVIAKLYQLAGEFGQFPIMIGISRKSFIGKLLDNAPADERLHGTIASVVASVLNGAHIVRVHDVKAAVEAIKVADAVRLAANQ